MSSDGLRCWFDKLTTGRIALQDLESRYPTRLQTEEMKIFVKAKTGQKENKVTPPPLKLIRDTDTEEYYVVSVKECPVEGRANEAITKLLAEHFGVSRSQIKLVSGAISKKKVFEVSK